MRRSDAVELARFDAEVRLQVVDQTAGNAAAGSARDAASERTPRGEVLVCRAAGAGFEIDTLEGVRRVFRDLDTVAPTIAAVLLAGSIGANRRTDRSTTAS